MSDNFENNMSDQMRSFRMNPDPQIWERVAAALPPEKRRRRFAIWWWMLPLAGCLGGGLWLVIHQPKNVDESRTKKVTGIPYTGNGMSKQTANIIPEDTISNSITQKPLNSKKTYAAKQLVELKKDTIGKRNNIIENDYRKEIAPQYFSNEDKQPDKNASPRLRKNVVLQRYYKSNEIIQPGMENNVGGNRLYNSKNILIPNDKDVIFQHLYANEFQLQQPVLMDSLVLYAKPNILLANLIAPPVPAVVTKDLVAKNKLDSLATATKKNKYTSVKNKVEKIKWTMLFAAGKSSLRGGFNNTEKVLAANYNSGLSTSNQFSGKFINPQAGISFNIGIARQQSINNHWSWQTELSYQYLSSKQLIGNRNDSLVFNNFLADAYYIRVTQSSNLFTNRVHRIQLSPEIIYTLNPNSKSPISFIVGATVSYHLSNSLLLHDYRSGSYIRSVQLSNNILLSGITGADVFINKKVHARIAFEHDFTNVAKPKVGSIFHWNQLQIQIGIPLSK